MTVLAKTMQSVYNRLVEQKTLMGENPTWDVVVSLPPDAQISGVYDTIPQGTTLPYVVFGEMKETPRPTFGKTAYEVEITLYIWTNDADSLKLLKIMEDIEAALTQPVTVDGYTTVDQRIGTREIRRHGNYTMWIPIVLNLYIEEST